MSFWKKTMDYLGLGPDDAYDDYDDQVEPEPPTRSSRSSGDARSGRSTQSRNWPTESDETVIKAVPARPSFPSRDFESPARRAAAQSASNDDSGMHSRPAPRPAAPSRAPAPPPSSEPATVRPRRFDQAQELADKFKEGLPVIMNLEAADREVSRRLIDFASGLCYALNGSMEKVASGVYLLKPIGRQGHGGYDN